MGGPVLVWTLPRNSGQGGRTGMEPYWMVFPVKTEAAGKLPGAVDTSAGSIFVSGRLQECLRRLGVQTGMCQLRESIWPELCIPASVQNHEQHWEGASVHQRQAWKNLGAPVPCLGAGPSATTRISVWNTRVFWKALMALMEPHTHGWRIARCPSPRWRVAVQTYLLYFVVTYTDHQNDTCVTLFAGAADMLKPFTKRLAIDEKPGSTSNHSHVYSLYSHPCIYVAMYLYSYSSTHGISGLAAVCRIYTPRHPVHLRYPCISVQPQSLLEDILDRVRLRCTWRRRLSELRDSLGDWDWVNSEMHLEEGIKRVWRCAWRPWSCELAGRNRASLKIYLEAVMEPVWRYTWRLWSSEIGRLLGGGRWTVRRVSIQQLVNSQPWECDKVTLPLKLLWRTGWWRSISRKVRWKLNRHSGVNLKSWEFRDVRQS